MNYNYTQIIEALLQNNVVKATKYVAPNFIIRATRKRHGGRILSNSNVEITLTIGKPNYIEREFIRDCKKAGEPFPVKMMQLKLYSPKKKPLKRKLALK